MQIFQWFFKVAQEETGQNSSCHHINKKVTCEKGDETGDIILYKQRGVSRRRSKRVKESDHRCLGGGGGGGGGNYFKPFAYLCRKDVAQTCFYRTLSLRRLASINRGLHSHCSHPKNKMKKEEVAHHHHARGLGSANKADSTAAHAVNKVSPISGATSTLSSSSTNPSNKQCRAVVESKKDNNHHHNKTRTMSRMKELLRWAAAAKSEKGGKFLGRKVLHFRNRTATLKSVPDDDQLSLESPKISFRWDVETCSTISSAYSAISMVTSSSKINNNNNRISLVSSTPIHDRISHLRTPRKGNWITTDSEFVVLEL